MKQHKIMNEIPVTNGEGYEILGYGPVIFGPCVALRISIRLKIKIVPNHISISWLFYIPLFWTGAVCI
jgi:hypothetical protein